WPAGPNVTINVEPADTCCANIIYNVFVRQFGPNKAGGFFENIPPGWVDGLDRSGYTVIPPSGTFRDLITELDFIVYELGCRILQLLPVHPTPTTYARMGRFGSPYAALSFTAVDPALASFDPKATPLEQFVELVDAIHARNAKVMIDIAINHTGWAADLHGAHPEWLMRDASGKIEVPGAWGVNWEDLTRLDYSRRDLWQYMADVFLTWCRRGVDGFRCDAGYMIPLAAWQYIIASVKVQFPGAIFFMEGLGGKISVMRDLLNLANFNWAYSELFQNYERSQVEDYLPEAIRISESDGMMVHFAETHDNPRLASRSIVHAKMRTALCALCSQQGAFGFANGLEWYATEKINVHQAPSLNWRAEVNQVADIARLTLLLKNHPVFFDRTTLHLVPQTGGNGMVLIRHHQPTDKRLMVLVNLDDRHPQTVGWDPGKNGFSASVLMDLLSVAQKPVSRAGGLNKIELQAGQVLCLSADPADRQFIFAAQQPDRGLPQRIRRQCLRAKALDVFQFYHPDSDLNGFDPDLAATRLADDPAAFCAGQNPDGEDPRTITWQWPGDMGREVMVPPGYFLLIRAAASFRARIEKHQAVLAVEEGLAGKDGTFFALFSPLPPPRSHEPCQLNLSVHAPGRCEHASAPLLFLSRPEDVRVRQSFSRRDLADADLCFLDTNDRGSVLKCPLAWGRLDSRYDALLAASPRPDLPENRWIMFTRCRIWAVYQDYSRQIGPDFMDRFTRDPSGRGTWRFRVPVGGGKAVAVTIRLELLKDANALRMILTRLPAGSQADGPADDMPVRFILRPDIENRDFHGTTKAYQGPENTWPNSIAADSSGFNFDPDDEHHLTIRVDPGGFVHEPEWQYMVFRKKDKERGQDPDSDLFSPGYFTILLQGGQSAVLSAAVKTSRDPGAALSAPENPPATRSAGSGDLELALLDVLQGSMNQFVIPRQPHKSVIAGFPWFLDWGRDALIFARGLVAAGQVRTAQEIIRLFGRYEKNGTLPNMIVGKNAQNRDTSDAPLWLGVVCSDMVRRQQSTAFLDEPCGRRTLRQILLSIGRAMINGTPNNIHMDPESGLLFSPSHFTWMDTDHPAATPRQGYPVEIQGLWFALLQFLSTIDSRGRWKSLTGQVRNSILECFFLPDAGFFSDCLHAGSGTPARQAAPDDALRPNQLILIALGAVNDISACRRAVTACQELLVPGAIRSLADRPVKRPLEILFRGKALNDPRHPYWGKYAGDEDTQRKPAYHNGTAWTWMLPVFCEAYVAVFGKKSKIAAMAWLSGATRLLETGCVGHLPEIVDGDYPHLQRGCDAQAWGISELVRVWCRLEAL
ncbi:MAG: amylo-alpha-1,6-glucosidase, partial [Desulfobacterales bacterium]|nr:amylo-alpha-1,6-glucosidase [Desulfobacterales bacterium]